MRRPLALLCLVALAHVALARLGPTQTPEARPLLEAGTQLVFTGTEAVTPPCDLTDIAAALSSPNCSSASNYTTLVPAGAVLQPGQATVYTRHYNNTDDLLALNMNGIAWDITAPEGVTKEMLLALGVAANNRAAEACLLQLLNGNACNSSEVKFLWGSGIEADVLGDASSGGVRVSQPVLLRIPANIPGLVAAIAAPAEQPWRVIASDELRSLPAPEFVLFAGVAANVSVTVNAVALLGLTVVPVDPTAAARNSSMAAEPGPALSNPDGSTVVGGGGGGETVAPPTGGVPSSTPIPEPGVPDGGISGGGGAAPASPDTVPTSGPTAGSDPTGGVGSPAASPTAPASQVPVPPAATPPFEAPAPAAGPSASPAPAAVPSPSPKPGETVPLPPSPSPEPTEPAPAPPPSPEPTPVTSAPSPSPKPAEPTPVPSPSPSPKLAEPVPAPLPSPKPIAIPPSPSPKPAEPAPGSPPAAPSPAPAPTSVDSGAGGGKSEDGTTASPPSSQPGPAPTPASGGSGGGGDAAPVATKDPPSTDLPDNPIQ